MNSVRIKPSNGLYIYHSRRLSNLWWNFGDLKSHFLRSGIPEQSLKLIFRVTSSVAISLPKELIFLIFIFFICDCGVTCQVCTGKFSSTRLRRKSIERLWWVYKLVH
uniref:Uncharacterized protein n=1 Tax=Populus trichocarpa TaxID=3694 RepID=A0A2K1XEA6_POPTR